MKRIAAIAAALATGLALSLGAATAASAGTDPVVCNANHAGYTGTQTSAAGFSLAIGSGAPQSVLVPNFTSPFGTNSKFDQIHPAQFAADNGLLIQWCVGSSPRVLAEVSGRAVFLPETAANVNSSSDLVYNGDTQQLVVKATGDALSLSGGFLGMGGVTFVPAGHGQAATVLHFTPSS